MVFRRLPGFLRNHDRISKGARERPLSTYFREINPYRWGRPPENGEGHVVLTLDPKKFAEKKQARLRISNLQSFQPYVALQNQSTPALDLHIYYNRNHRSEIPPLYPRKTTAFLYYSTPPGKPRIAGELRLRIASSDDHASFESGSDLLMPNSLPWSRSLYYVSKHYSLLYQKLREEGFVSDDLDAVLLPFRQNALVRQTLYTLNDPFIVDFNAYVQDLYIVTEQGVEDLRLVGPCVDQRQRSKAKGRRKPYTGSAWARFERSTLPQHEGTRTVVLRFLKLITPVECVIPLYDGYIVLPQEGELYRRSRGLYQLQNPPIWSSNIDIRVELRGLQFLWDI